MNNYKELQQKINKILPERCDFEYLKPLSQQESLCGELLTLFAK